MPSEIEYAAGGLVLHRSMILLVRRIGRGWELPKGRLEPGESAESAAIREVLEETGYFCKLGEAIAPVRYFNTKGQAKQVNFWHMVIQSIASTPPDSAIDAVLWCLPHEATMRLRHEHERIIIENHIPGPS